MTRRSKVQRSGRFQVRQTSLHNPNFAEFAQLYGAAGFRATTPAEVGLAIAAGLATDGSAIVEILTDPLQM